MTGRGRVSLLGASFALQEFNRLRELVFVDAFFEEWLLVSGLGSRSIGDGYRLVYDLSVEEEDAEAIEWVGKDLDTTEPEERGSWVDSVVVHLCTTKQRDRLLTLAAGSSLLPRTTILVKSPTET